MKTLMFGLKCGLLLIAAAMVANGQPTKVKPNQITCESSTANPMVMVRLPNSNKMVCAAIGANLVLDASTNPPTLRAIVTAAQGPQFVDDETPFGQINGINVLFTLANAPSPAASLVLYRNGIRQRAGVDYNLVGSMITFVAEATPQSGDLLVADYRR